jgi:hypothetical protein
MKLALAPRFVRQYGTLSETDRQLCDVAIEALPASFGYPHRHAGLGLRALRRGVYECRPSQAVRIGFTRHGDTLVLHTVGNHAVIRAWLRSGIV